MELLLLRVRPVAEDAEHVQAGEAYTLAPVDFGL
jgi:hypothetical protein